ncbi:alpha/beta hydrolase [Candidimonas nitroreducens]|nr:alpha/beta hydrolase [Candidimonas nitroreducens]
MNHIPADDTSEFRNESDYNLKRRHPERTALYDEYAQRSETMRNNIAWSSFAYDTPDRCVLDWFPAEHSVGAPLMIFVHGGYWRGGDKRVFSFLAEGFRAEGVSMAMVGYELAPSVSIETIGIQVRRAIRHVMQKQRELGFDSSRVTLSGHSAGAHLVAMASAYPDELGVDGSALRVVGMSGVYDLTPVLESSLRQEIGLTPAEAASQSLPNGRLMKASEYLLLVGERETPAFIDQSRTFHRALVERGVPSELQIVPGCMHFDIFKPLADRNDPVHRRVLETVTRR